MQGAKEQQERTESSGSYLERIQSDKWQQKMARIDGEREADAARRLATTETVAVESQEAEAKEACKNGYCCRFLVQATLPHSKPPPGVNEFKRVNGNLTLSIVARSEYGLPYGCHPRQIFAWIGHEAVAKRSPTIFAGASLREFVTTKLGRKYSSGKRGTASSIRDQLVRTVSADIQATVRKDGVLANKRLSPIDQTIVFWDPDDHKRIADWQAELTLAPLFYEELIAHPIPVCLKTLCGFHGPMQMDIYAWLTHRMSYLKEKTTIPWEGLHAQFGCGYPNTPRGLRNFKIFFLKSLREVLLQYTTARVYPTAAGLVLEPSPTHIPLKSIPDSKR